MKAKAKIIIENQGNLLLLRPLDKKKFTLIGGTVNKKEKPSQTIIREAHEEAGVKIEMKNISFFHGCITQINKKDYYFYCFLLENQDVLFELKEHNKFKYVDWIPIHFALDKLRGIEKKMVQKFINEKSIKAKLNKEIDDTLAS